MSDSIAEISDTKKICFTEIKIPVPWGHIAGKAWGNSADRHLLAIHGIQDNCGVFDRLIYKLDGDYYVIAVDLPGHGHSTHFPVGVPLSFLNYVLAIAYVVKELRWEQFLLLGHSFGGQIGAFFTAMFPHLVQKLIILDHIAPTYFRPDGLIQSMSNYITTFMTLEQRVRDGKSPVYTPSEALDKLTNRTSSLTTDAAKIVLERNLKEIPGGYTFCMDQRLKLILFPTLSLELIKQVYENIKRPTLILLSSAREKQYREIFAEVFTIIHKKSNMTVEVVLGNHDVHQNHPERVVPFLKDFFSTELCKL